MFPVTARPGGAQRLAVWSVAIRDSAIISVCLVGDKTGGGVIEPLRGVQNLTVASGSERNGTSGGIIAVPHGIGGTGNGNQPSQSVVGGGGGIAQNIGVDDLAPEGILDEPLSGIDVTASDIDQRHITGSEIVAYQLTSAQRLRDRIELADMIGAAEGIVVGEGVVVGVSGLDDSAKTAFSGGGSRGVGPGSRRQGLAGGRVGGLGGGDRAAGSHADRNVH